MKKYWRGIFPLLLLVSFGIVVYFLKFDQNDTEQRRIQLLQEALAPKTSEGAAFSWADAVKNRNGAWQYALMDTALGQQYLKTFEDNNWVTGFSSPWVQKYRITRDSVDDKGNVTFQVKFDWYTSSGYAYSSIASLMASSFNKSEVNEHWLITYLDFSYEPDR